MSIETDDDGDGRLGDVGAFRDREEGEGRGTQGRKEGGEMEGEGGDVAREIASRARSCTGGSVVHLHGNDRRPTLRSVAVPVPGVLVLVDQTEEKDQGARNLAFWILLPAGLRVCHDPSRHLRQSPLRRTSGQRRLVARDRRIIAYHYEFVGGAGIPQRHQGGGEKATTNGWKARVRRTPIHLPFAIMICADGLAQACYPFLRAMTNLDIPARSETMRML